MSNHSEYPKEAGIYKLTCIPNGKIYIGKAVNIQRRINQHRNSKQGSKRNYLFQIAILKHGWDSFKVEILDVVYNFDKLKDNPNLLERESYYIKLFDSTNRDKGYNRCKYSNDRTGIPVSLETREKMSKARLGKTHSDDAKEKMSRSKLGKKLSEDHKQKMRKPKSEEHKQKLKIPHTKETKEKMSKARKGKPRSKEHSEAIRLAKLNKKLTPP